VKRTQDNDLRRAEGCGRMVLGGAYSGRDPDARLESLRDLARSLQCHCAATCVSGLIVVRFAAKLASDLRQALRRLIERFGEQLGFGPFRVLKMGSSS